MRVEHEEGADRFVARVAGGEAELDYGFVDGRVLDLRRTYVPDEARGKGVADALVSAAFRWARENDYRVRPSCPFARKWVARHPDEREVLEVG